MNALEAAICMSIQKTHKEYYQITNYWLWHAPEHFIQSMLLLDLGKNWEVYPEATRRKISTGMGKSIRGRPPSQRTARYDLVVWHKASDRIRAVIEIKKVYSATKGARQDAGRVRKAMTSGHRASAGYFLLYSELKCKPDTHKLEQKITGWAKELNMRLVHTKAFSEASDPDWVWGYGLFRAEPKAKQK